MSMIRCTCRCVAHEGYPLRRAIESHDHTGVRPRPPWIHTSRHRLETRGEHSSGQFLDLIVARENHSRGAQQGCQEGRHRLHTARRADGSKLRVI